MLNQKMERTNYLCSMKSNKKGVLLLLAAAGAFLFWLFKTKSGKEFKENTAKKFTDFFGSGNPSQY